MKPFIKTSDLETAEKLRKAGFKELAKDGKFFVFINDSKMNKEIFNQEKLVFSAMLNT